MKKKTTSLLLIFLLAASFSLNIFLISIKTAAPDGNPTQKYNEPYICSMHPYIISEGPGECEECGMNLSRLEGHKPGTALPLLEDIYTSPDNPMYVHEGRSKDPNTNSELIPITQSPIYQPQKEHTHTASSGSSYSDHAVEKEDGVLYTCGMHPDVIQDEPGICPICNMDLTPIRSKGGSSSGERKIAYWIAPMDPNFISDKPGKSPMGMDLVPVYEDNLTIEVVSIDPVTVRNIGVTTTLSEIKDLTVELRTNGIVTIAEEAEYRINPKISGWIEKLYVSRTGDMVEKGDPLLDIYSPDLVSAQEEYLLALKTAAILTASNLDRISKGAGDLIEAARRRLEYWDIDNSQIEELERNGAVRRTLTLYSPVFGIIMHKNAVEGAAVKAGTDLFHIVDLSTVWVEAQVYEHEMPSIQAGNAVVVKSPYDQDVSLQGHVDYIYPYLDQKTRTATARIVVSNPDLVLRPDMYVDVRLESKPQMDAIVVPKNSVIRSGKRDLVFVAVGEGRFLPREVKVGLETDDYYEIVDGLSPGTAVVTSAQFLLDSEAKLQEAIQRRLQKRLESKKAL